MGTHQRQAIREAVVAQLRGKTGAEDRVFTTRAVPWKKTELPGIAVYTLEEAVGSARTLPRELVRTLTLAVLGVVSDGVDAGNTDDQLDALALEIESAMHADPTFGGSPAEDSMLTSTAIEVTEDQGRPLGVVRLTYEVRYYTPAAPE